MARSRNMYNWTAAARSYRMMTLSDSSPAFRSSPNRGEECDSRMNRALKRKAPPVCWPAVEHKRRRRDLGFDRVGALPVLSFGRCNRQAHLLADDARQEPANGMRLPAGDFHELLLGDPVRPLQQVEDLQIGRA